MYLEKKLDEPSKSLDTNESQEKIGNENLNIDDTVDKN